MSIKMVAGTARAEFAKRWASVLKNKIRFYFSPAFADSLGLFVSVGSRGVIYTSTNGSSWNKRESPVTTNLYSVYWNGSMFVIVGANGVILTSVDGINWTVQTSGVSSSLYAVAWNGSMFVVVGAGGLILTSLDGINWTVRTSGTTANLRDIVWTGSQFVAIGDGGVILYSANGINWTLGSIGAPAGTVFFDILWNGSMFVAVGTGGAIYTSIDGITWIQRSSGVTSTLYSVIWDGTQFIIVGANGTILSSPDGITWTVVASGGADLFGLVLYNGKVTITGDGVALTSNAGGSLSFSETVLDSELLDIPEFGSLLFTLDNPNAYGTSAGDAFGNSVAISNQYTIVGAHPEDDAGGQGSGKAYIFDNATGALLHTLDNPNAYGTSDGDQFGQSVAISGLYAIVGAHQEDEAGGSNSGKAYIFNPSTGALLHTLNNPNAYGTVLNDWFGFSVAISNQYAIVGAHQEDEDGGTNSGKAYIFNSSTGALLHTLDNPNAYGTTSTDGFGRSVAISDQYAIVGVRMEDDAGGNDSGKAYIFNPSTGALLHTLDDPNAYGTSASDWFGSSVAISDQYAIVGAYGEGEVGGIYSGKAYIYSTSTWTLLHTLDNPNAYGTGAHDNFGFSVSISNQYAIVGAYKEDEDGGNNSGKAYIFNNATGALLHTLDNPNPYGTSTEDEFGFSVAISDQYAIVGAYREDEAADGFDSGKAYIFSVQ